MTRFLPPLLFAGLALFYLAHATGFNDPTSAQAPALYGQAMLAMAALVFVAAFLRLRSDERKEAGEDLNLRKVATIFTILCGFVALVLAVGFYAASPVFLLFFFILFARMKVWLSLVWALAATGLVWGIFGQLLHMRVFGGYLL